MRSCEWFLMFQGARALKTLKGKRQGFLIVDDVDSGKMSTHARRIWRDLDTAAKWVRMLETRAKLYARKGMGMTIFP